MSNNQMQALVSNNDKLCNTFEMLVERLSSLENTLELFKEDMIEHAKIQDAVSGLGSYISGRLYCKRKFLIQKCFEQIDVQYPFNDILIIDIPPTYQFNSREGISYGSMIPHDFTILNDDPKYEHVRQVLQNDILGTQLYKTFQDKYMMYLSRRRVRFTGYGDEHSSEPRDENNNLQININSTLPFCVPCSHLGMEPCSQLYIDEYLYGLYLRHIFPYIKCFGTQEIVLDKKKLSKHYNNALEISFDILFNVLDTLSTYINVSTPERHDINSYIPIHSVRHEFQNLYIALISKVDRDISHQWECLSPAHKEELKRCVKFEREYYKACKTQFINYSRLQNTPILSYFI